jgi:hypothetical protein
VKELKQLITEEQIKIAFKDYSFDKSNIEVLKEALLKTACGHYLPYSTQSIINELGLCDRLRLTKKGKECLYLLCSGEEQKNKKPLSELTVGDAIEIAEACVNDDNIDWIGRTDSVKCVSIRPKDSLHKVFFNISKKEFSIFYYVVHFDDLQLLDFNAAKAVDKARELGYDI